MEWYQITLLIFGIIIVLYLIAGYVVTYLIAYPKKDSREVSKEKNHKAGKDIGSEVLERKPIEFKMEDGYVIHGDYSKCGNEDKIIILVHGYASNREGMLRYATLMNSLGYSAILYDQRAHGDNAKTAVTMGYRESKDLVEIINQVREKFGNDIKLGLMGCSMGAATIMLSLQYQQKVDFVIEDCGYAKFLDVVEIKIKNSKGLTAFLFPGINLMSKIFHGYFFGEVSAVNTIANNKVPILIQHGDVDDFVPVKDAYLLDKAITAKHKLNIYPNAGHCKAYTEYHDRYIQEIKDFLDSLN